MEKERSVRARKPVFEPVTSAHIPLSEAQSFGHMQLQGRMEICIQICQPCTLLKLYQNAWRRMDTVGVGIVSAASREFRRICQVEATANMILQKQSGSCASMATAMRLTSYCPHICTSSTEVSEYQERVTYQPSQNQ